MRDVYTAKLSRLSDEILEMGNLCGQAIMKTCQLLASVEVREAATKEIGRIEKGRLTTKSIILRLCACSFF